MSGFAQARADIAHAMTKLATLDRVFAMMEEFSGLLSAVGQRPELSYDDATGRIALEVVVGRVPPRVMIAVEEAAPAAALPPPAAPPADDGKAASATRLPRFKTGPWTDEEVDLAAELVGQGLTNKEIAARLNRSATGIHFRLDPLRKLAADDADREAAGRADGRDGAPEAADEDPVGAAAPVEAAELPAAVEVEPPVLAIEDCGDDAWDASAVRAPAAWPPAELTMAERHVWEHLEFCQSDAWPPARDLDLVERIVRGDGAGGAAEALGITKGHALARWRELFPGTPSIEDQARMLRVLRARIAMGAST